MFIALENCEQIYVYLTLTRPDSTQALRGARQTPLNTRLIEFISLF